MVKANTCTENEYSIVIKPLNGESIHCNTMKELVSRYNNLIEPYKDMEETIGSHIDIEFFYKENFKCHIVFYNKDKATYNLFEMLHIYFNRYAYEKDYNLYMSFLDELLMSEMNKKGK